MQSRVSTLPIAKLGVSPVVRAIEQDIDRLCALVSSDDFYPQVKRWKAGM